MTLPDTMPALVLRHDGRSGTMGGLAIADFAQWLAFEWIAVPRAGAGQVLIRVACSPVNPSDLHYIKGEYGQPRRRGAPAGFEGTGTVVAASDAQTQALLGRRVSFLANGSGSWARFALTDASACVVLDDAVRDDDAAALLVNPLTALAMMARVQEAGVRAVVLTAAASQLGRMLIALASERAIAAIAIVRKAGEEAALQALGAKAVLVSTAADFAARFDAVVRTEKPRVLLDAVGDQTAADLFQAMPAHTRWVSYGMLAESGPRLAHMGQFVFSGKSIEGFWLSRWLNDAPAPVRAAAESEAQRRFATGLWRTRAAACVRLADALRDLPAALQLAGKVLLVPGEN